MIADYLRVRFHRLRPAAPLSGHTKALRAVGRTLGDLAFLTQYPTAGLTEKRLAGTLDLIVSEGIGDAVLARILARVWVRVIWGCWQNTPYEPALYGSTRQHLNQRVVT